MNPGFSVQQFKVSTEDGRNFILLEDVYYTTKAGVFYRIPAGATSDGASTPSFLWNTIPPFGSYWRAAFLHDSAYRNTLEVEQDGEWVKARLTKDVCDLLLEEAMELSGTHLITYKEIYEGVRLGGKSSFDADREANP